MQPIDRRLNNLQWQLNLATAIFSAVAIGLAFADQRTLAQLCLILVTLSFLGSVVVAVYRYQRNKKRRDEILTQFEKERNVKLEELFDEARRQKNLPPDSQDRTGFNAFLKAGQERIDALEGKNKPKNGGKDGGRK
jgi:hypothetical protein